MAPSMAKKPRPFNAKKEVRAIARERVGPVKPARVIRPKSERRPKYPTDPVADES